MPSILMQHFSSASFISDYGIRQLAPRCWDVCVWVHKKCLQRRCTLRWAPVLKARLSWRELWHSSLRPAVRGLSCSRAESSSSGPLLGFRGQKHIIQSDFAKLNKSSATVKGKMSQQRPRRRWLSVPAGFFGVSDLSKQGLIKLFDLLEPKIKQDTNRRVP